ncbi:hypothetical protein [Thalassobacillus hwangdonensis]|uniref:Uncharacterized protein n=1 Tax=Thalassobacillus hwangdonensis TaxID=546108 RepID=A0ABW3L2C0_9BACI
MKKFYYAGLILIITFGLFTVVTSQINGKADQDDFAERTIALADFIDDRLNSEGADARMSYVQHDKENYPKVLIYITAGTKADDVMVEKKVDELVRSADLLKENEKYEIIVSNQ